MVLFPYLVVFLVQLFRVWSISHLYLVLKTDHSEPFMVEFPNPSHVPLLDSFCDENAAKFRHEALVAKCHSHLLPLLDKIDTDNTYFEKGYKIPVFVVLHTESESLLLARRLRLQVRYDTDACIGIVFHMSDPLRARELLSMHSWPKT